MRIKEKLTDALLVVYEPVAVRWEKMKAARMWRDGVKQCEKMYRELKGPRVYLFFDANHMVWSPMTYEPNKQYKPALRQLRVMGKMHGSEKVQGVSDMKRYSYYYTPSKWGALGCDEDNKVRARKLQQWITYYMARLSEPMRKIRDYRQRKASKKSQAC